MKEASVGKPPFFAAGVVRRNQLARTDGRAAEVFGVGVFGGV